MIRSGIRLLARIRHTLIGYKIRLQAFRKPVKLVIGASGRYQAGWIATDVEHLNLLRPGDWEKYFKAGSVDAILAEHVWEHLSADEAYVAAQICYRYLKPNGYIRTAVPDGLHISKDYHDQVKPGGTGAGADDHKVLYTYKTLSHVFETAGFHVNLIEYYDEQGIFHHHSWRPENGLIHRSSIYDERNKNGQCNYTSIMIDAYKR